jgi:hypothetical protein
VLYVPTVSKWEYTQLRLTCDPGQDGMPIHGWLAPPGSESWEKLGVLAKPKSVIDKLGSEGWEMVGGPTSQNSVFTYKASNDTWHDRSYWVERDYWFKRPAGS